MECGAALSTISLSTVRSRLHRSVFPPTYYRREQSRVPACRTSKSTSRNKDLFRLPATSSFDVVRHPIQVTHASNSLLILSRHLNIKKLQVEALVQTKRLLLDAMADTAANTVNNRECQGECGRICQD